MLISRKSLLFGLILILFLAPFPFGSVEPKVRAVLEAAVLGLAIFWLVWRGRNGLSLLPWKDPVFLGGMLILLLGGLQLVPLPRSVLQTLSPRTQEVRDRFEVKEASPTSGEVGSFPSLETWRPLSLYPWATRRAMVGTLVCLLVVLITLDLAGKSGGRKGIAWALVAGGSFQAIYGLWEFFSGRQHIFAFEKKYYADVATGTFINRNHFAGYLEMILPLAVVLAVAAMAPREPAHGGRTNGPRRSSLGGGRGTFQGSLFLLLALTMTVALICSRSRMGIVSSLVSLALVGAILTWKRRNAGFVVSVLLVVGVAILLFGQGNSGPLIDRYLGTPNELHDGFGRWALWQQAGRMALAFPLMGVGYGAFPFVFPMFRSTGAGAAVSHAHNDYLEIIVETGAVGCLLGIALVILGIRTLLCRGGIRPDFGFLGYGALAGVLAMGLHSFTDFNLAIPANALTLSALIGMMICWTRVPKPALVGVTGTVSHRSWRVWIPAGVLMAVAPVVLEPLVGADPIAESGDLPYRASPTRLGATFLPPDNAERIFQTAARIGDAAIDDFRIIEQTREIGDDPSELTVKYIRRRLEDAISLQSRGLRYLPTSSSGHLLMAHLLAARCGVEVGSPSVNKHCLEPANRQVHAALVLNPMGARVHAQAARFWIHNWNWLEFYQQEEAREIIHRAVSMNYGDRNLRDLALPYLDLPGSGLEARR